MSNSTPRVMCVFPQKKYEKVLDSLYETIRWSARPGRKFKPCWKDKVEIKGLKRSEKR